MNLRTKSLIAGLTFTGMLGGCAVVAPPPLVDARAAYAISSSGIAAQWSPTELYDAKKSLDRANKEFDAEGDTLAVRDYAYVAHRKVELADVKARTEMDRQRVAEAVKQGVVLRDSQVRSSQAALASTRSQLEEERSANSAETAQLRATSAAQGKELDKTSEQLEAEKVARAAQGKELEKTAEQLENEKAAHAKAETRLAGAMKDLATIASVREEARGVVITLSGSVLFASGRFALLETAKLKLNQVAEALRAQADDKRMVVEGHTDSQGTVGVNMPLSLNRANAVRDYLIIHGVSGNKIEAVGLGSTRPLLDNANAENRANNRRVEIVIQNARMSTR